MRFVRFNAVGAIGFAVQMCALVSLLRAGVPYLLATTLAVEASVLNNFVWHERWTWRDRPAASRTRLQRLARFHALNGVVSLGGNIAITWAMVAVWTSRPSPSRASGIRSMEASLRSNLLCRTERERDEGQRRVRAAAGRQRWRSSDEQILVIVRAAVAVAHARLRIVPHPASA
jgi:putative flippase GtrA